MIANNKQKHQVRRITSNIQRHDTRLSKKHDLHPATALRSQTADKHDFTSAFASLLIRTACPNQSGLHIIHSSLFNIEH